LPLPLADDLVETGPLVGAQQLQIRRSAGCHQPFAVTLRTMLRIDLATRALCRLRVSGRDLANDGRGNEKTGAPDIMHASGALACAIDGTAPPASNESTEAREKPHEVHGSAKTKIELCPRTAFGMLFWVRLSGPAETDWPSPVNTMTYCLPFTA